MASSTPATMRGGRRSDLSLWPIVLLATMATTVSSRENNEAEGQGSIHVREP
jgi:hypothetical protein